MQSKIFENFSGTIQWLAKQLYTHGYEVHTEKWQGLDIREKEAFGHFEILNYSFSSKISPDLKILQKEIGPNLPWADDHFLERVGGLPINPGEQYKNWPYYKNNPSNDKFRTEKDFKFSHSYMESMWTSALNGIRYQYGNLQDVVNLLDKEPLTRQAFLPIWFPEDTGVKHGGRVPCTLGYHFIRRSDYLHIVYYIRSCDFIRHFRDDVYLACRLNLWMIEKLKKLRIEHWLDVKPGLLTMHMTSLHIFKNEKELLKKQF